MLIKPHGFLFLEYFLGKYEEEKIIKKLELIVVASFKLICL